MGSHTIAPNLKKEIIDHPYMTVATFIILTVMIVVAAIFLSYILLLLLLPLFIYDSSHNTTLLNMTSFVSQNSSDFVSIFVNTMLTLGLIFSSVLSLSSAQDALKQSKDQQTQFQNELRVRDIEKQLEEFYIPASDILNDEGRKTHKQMIIGHRNNLGKSDNKIPIIQIGLIEISKYQYLAKPNICKAFKEYIKKEVNSTLKIGENNSDIINLRSLIEDEIEALEKELKKLKNNNMQIIEKIEQHS